MEKRLKDSNFLNLLNLNQEVHGYTSPTTGKITYNKVVSKKSFAIFTDIITSIVPLDIINDPSKQHLLPSIANILTTTSTPPYIYPIYLILNATMEEYMDYEDEEDQENMSELLSSLTEIKIPIIGIAIQKSEHMGSAHAIAFIAWKYTNSKYKFAYYDSLAYKRGNNSYDYTDRAFVKHRFSQNIEFINLNEYCFHKNEKDFHCLQYIINAEYCYIYSLFFLKKWLDNGAKLHRATFKKSIVQTYIVKPELLTRANNKESMIYRVIMMAFICQSLITYLKSLNKKTKKYIKHVNQNINRIHDYLTEFKNLYGFLLF
jgi:hypothetical protein